MRMLLDIVRQSLSTLWAHKHRSFLTMFGIAWGVGSLLLLVGLGEGFRSGQEKQLATLGQDIMFMFPGPWKSGALAPRESTEISAGFSPSYPLVVVAGLQEIDSVSTHAIHHAMLLGEPARPTSRPFAL